MKLPDSLRDQLKIPLGLLLPIGQDNKKNIQKYLSDDSYVITVGDRTTEKMIEYGIIPSLQIVDGFEKRQKREFPKLGKESELKIDNPAAEITLQSIQIIKKAFEMTSSYSFDCKWRRGFTGITCLHICTKKFSYFVWSTQ